MSDKSVNYGLYARQGGLTAVASIVYIYKCQGLCRGLTGRLRLQPTAMVTNKGSCEIVFNTMRYTCPSFLDFTRQPYINNTLNRR